MFVVHKWLRSFKTRFKYGFISTCFREQINKLRRVVLCYDHNLLKHMPSLAYFEAINVFLCHLP